MWVDTGASVDAKQVHVLDGHVNPFSDGVSVPFAENCWDPFGDSNSCASCGGFIVAGHGKSRLEELPMLVASVNADNVKIRQPGFPQEDHSHVVFEGVCHDIAVLVVACDVDLPCF